MSSTAKSPTKQRIPKLIEPRAGAWPIEIVTGKYTGSYMLDQSNDQFFDAGTYHLNPGIHDFVVERFGGGAFQFAVSDQGLITAVSNNAAASYSGSRLTLKTTEVQVKPGGYGSEGGVYELDTHRHEDFGWSTAATAYDLIPGLVFVFSNGVRYAVDGNAGWFTFLVDAKGGVHPESDVVASGAPGSLDLNTAFVQITSWDTRHFYVGASNRPQYGGMTKARAAVVPGLLTCIRSVDGDIGFFTPIPGSSESGTVLVGAVKYGWKLL